MSKILGSLDIDEVMGGIYDWVESVMNSRVPPGQIIWRNGSEPLPARPCVTMKIIDGPRPIGRNASQFSSPKGSASNYGIQEEMQLSIQIFGNSKFPRPSAHQLAIDLNSSLIQQTILDKLKASGVSIQQVGQPRNLTELEETRYEQRFGFEVTMGLAQNVSDDPGYIETINLEENVGDIHRTVEIELP